MKTVARCHYRENTNPFYAKYNRIPNLFLNYYLKTSRVTQKSTDNTSVSIVFMIHLSYFAILKGLAEAVKKF